MALDVRRDTRQPRGGDRRPAAPRGSSLSLDDSLTLREFVDKIEEGVYITTVDGRILDANPAFLTIFGAGSLADLRGRLLRDLWLEPERRLDLHRLIDLRGAASNYEFEIRRLDGNTRWVSDSVYAIRDDAGDVIGYHGVLVDITARKLAEQALRNSEQKYRAIFDNVLDIFYQTDLEGRIIECSPAVQRYLGYSREELIGRHADVLYSDTGNREELRDTILEKGEVTDAEALMRTRNGDTVWFSVNARVIRDENGEPVGFEGTLRDIRERKELERRLEELSVRDPLTGCYNRRYLERVRPALERPTARWGCLVIDLDNFKAVNDSYGHDEGDRVLQGVAHFLRRHGRAEDVFVRLGGDEFAMIVQASSEEELEGIAARLAEVSPYESPAAFSVGIAYRQLGDTVEDVIARADRAMYAAKGKGMEPPTHRP